MEMQFVAQIVKLTSPEKLVEQSNYLTLLSGKDEHRKGKVHIADNGQNYLHPNARC